MQRALLQYTNVTYEVCSTQDGVQYDVTRYAYMADLLSATEYSRDLLCLLRDNYTNWILIPSELETLFIGYSEKGSIVVVGELGHAVFIGYTVADSVIAYGNYATLSDWVLDVTRGILVPTALGHEPVMFGDLLEARSMKQSMSFLQDLGVMPRLPRERVLSPVVTLQGTEYWVLLLDD